MLVKRVTLKNIRSYREGSVEFPEGIVLLAGDIGAGKTSLLLAIEFALFGLLGGELPGEALLRHGSSEGWVELEFELDGKSYIVKRRLKRKQGCVRQENGILISEEGVQELSAIELKSRVMELLGYPEGLKDSKKSALYRYTVYTPQEEMKRIISEKGEERLTTIRRIFNIDKYKLARENCEGIIRLLRQEIRGLEVSAEGLKSLEEELKVSQDKCEDLKGKENKLESEQARLSEEWNRLKKELDEIENKTIRLKQLANDKEIAENELKHLEQAKKEKEKGINERRLRAANLKKEYTSLEPEPTLPPHEISKLIEEKRGLLKELQQESRNIDEERARLNSRLDSQKKQRSSLNEKLTNLGELKARAAALELLVAKKPILENRIKEIKHAKEKAQLELKSIETQLEALQNALRGLDGAERCPVCLAPISIERCSEIISGHKKDIETLETRKSELRNGLDGHEKELQKLESEREAIVRDDSELLRLKGQLSSLPELQKELEFVNQNILEIENQLKKIGDTAQLNRREATVEKEIEELTNRLSDAKQAQLKLERRKKIEEELQGLKKEALVLDYEIKDITKKMQEINLRVEGINVELKGYEDLETQQSQLKQRIEETQEKERKVSIELARLREAISNEQKAMDRLMREIEEKRLKESAAQERRELVRWLEEFFMPLTETIERHVMAGVYNEFSQLFIKWFGLLMDDSEISVQLDESFSPIIIQNGFETSFESLSGGERTSLALAYRVALNKVINDVSSSIRTKGLIILDEPTDGFSSAQLDNLRRVLEELQVKQTIVVSHEPKIEGFVEKVIYINKQNGLSSAAVQE